MCMCVCMCVAFFAMSVNNYHTNWLHTNEVNFIFVLFICLYFTQFIKTCLCYILICILFVFMDIIDIKMKLLRE